MLSKSNQERLLKMLKVPDARVKELLADGEIELTDTDIPTLTILDEAGLTDLKANVKKGHETAYKEIWGKEMNAKYELGLSVTDAKDHDKVMEAMKNKGITEANIPANEKVKTLEASLKKLQEEVIPAEQRKYKEIEAKYNDRLMFDQYSSVIPKNANSFLTMEEHVNRVKGKVAIGENGVAINPATNQPYRDSMEKEILFNDYVSELYTKNDGWLQPEQKQQQQSFHHSTSGGGNGNGKSKVDVDAIRAKYNVADPADRQRMQAEITAATINASKN